MIEGGWIFVAAAYGLTGLSLLGLVLVVGWRLDNWARQARRLEAK